MATENYDIALRVTAPGSGSVLGGVVGGLERAEVQGQRTGQAISRGMREAGLAAERATAGVESFSASMGRGSAGIGRFTTDTQRWRDALGSAAAAAMRATEAIAQFVAPAGRARDASGRFLSTMERAEGAAIKLGAASSRALTEASIAAGRAGASVETFTNSLNRAGAGSQRFWSGSASSADRFRGALLSATAAAERATDVVSRMGAPAAHGQLVSSLGRVGMAFDGLTQAIAREQAMLDKINGPTRRYEQHLQTLDSLLAKNKISTEQYAEQVRRLNKELERSSTIKGPAAAPKQGLIARAGGALDRVGEVINPTRAVVGGVMALGVREVLGMASAYQTLQNRMKVVAAEGESVSSTFEKIRGLSVSTRMSIESTTIAYQRLKGSTKEMGMSSEDLLRVTGRINKAIVVSGASAAEAKGGMIQLAQGIASNRLGGEELRSVLENLPYVADILSQSLGITRGQLREWGAQGKLSAEVVVGAFEKLGSKIDADFAKTAPTLSQGWSMFTDQIMVTVGKIFEATGAFAILGGALEVVSGVLGFVGDIFGALHSGLSAASNGVVKLTEDIPVLGSVIEAILNPLQALRDGISALKEVAESGVMQDALHTIAGDLGSSKLNDVVVKALKAQIARQKEREKALLEEEKLAGADKTLDAARGAGVAVPEFDTRRAAEWKDWAKLVKNISGVSLSSEFDAATRKAAELGAGLDKIAKQRIADQLEDDIKRTDRALNGVTDSLRDQQREYDNLKAKGDLAAKTIEHLWQARGRLASQVQGGADALARAGGFDRTRQELAAQREMRDVQLELANYNYEYGATVVRVTKAEQEHVDSLGDLKGAMEAGRISARQFMEEVKRGGEATGPALDVMIKGLDAAVAKMAAARGALGEITRQEVEAGRMSRDLKIEQTNAERQYGDVIARITTEELQRKDAIADANGALKVGGINAKQWAEEMKRLGVDLGRTSEILERLNEPTKVWAQTVGALNVLARAGRIDLQQYNDELLKLAENSPVRSGELPRGAPDFVGGRRTKGLETAIGYEATSRDGAGVGAEGPSTLEALGIGESIDTKWLDQLDKAQQAMGGLWSATEKWRVENASAAQMLDRIAGPLRDYERGLADAKLLLDAGRISTKQYNDELTALKKTYDESQLKAETGKDLGAGLRRGLTSLRDEIMDIASQAEGALKNAFSSLEDGAVEMSNAFGTSLIDAISGADDAFKDFGETAKRIAKSIVNTLMSDLMRLSIRQAISGVLGIGGGGGGGPSAQASAATAVTASAAAAASAAVASAAAAAAAANAALGMAGGAAGGVPGNAISALGQVFGLPGLPGYAYGGSGVIGGSGAPDSKLFIARVTPGEHFQFTPPGQAARSDREAAPAPVFNVINVSDRSETRAWMEDEGERYFLNNMRRNEPARRGRTTGR